jgi:predicted adenine nucleotide alpha hydrolase (AANH) superfamily ATPase
LYRDFRPYFKEGRERAKALDLYRQRYCGCVFSEEDRFLEGKKDFITIQKFNNSAE